MLQPSHSRKRRPRGATAKIALKLLMRAGKRRRISARAAEMVHSGWTTQKAAGKGGDFSGIKLAPISGSEGQAASRTPHEALQRPSGARRGKKAGMGKGRARPGLRGTPARAWSRPRPSPGRTPPAAGRGRSKWPEARRTLSGARQPASPSEGGTPPRAGASSDL